MFAELTIGGVPAAAATPPTKTSEFATEPSATPVEERGDQVVQIMAQKKEIEENFEEDADDFWNSCFQVTSLPIELRTFPHVHLSIKTDPWEES